MVRKMSEQLHEHEFLLLLLDLAEGSSIHSEEYTNIEQIQEKFLINEENKYDIVYTILQSTVIDPSENTKHLWGNGRLNDHMMEKHRMWPFDGEKNE